MRVLVVGGAGHYSSLISEHLSTEHDLTVLDVQPSKKGFWSKCIVGSITDPDATYEACKGHDAIVSFHKGDADVSSVGTAILLGAAERAGISQVIYTSSAGMAYPIPALSGENPLRGEAREDAYWRGRLPVTENHGLYPGNEAIGYFTNKWIGEQIGRMFEERGVYMTAIRPGNLMHDDMGCRDFEAEKVVDHIHLLMCGHVTVRDAARMYRAALERPCSGFRVANLANDTAYSLVSTDASARQLRFRCADPQIYLDFYGRQEWDRVYTELARRRFPSVLLEEIRASR